MSESKGTMGRDFCVGLLSVAGATVWLCLYPLSWKQVAGCALIAGAGLCLPWHRMLTLQWILRLVAAGFGLRGSMELVHCLQPEIPFWGLWLGMGGLLFFLIYVGRRAVRACAVLPALCAAVALAVGTVGCAVVWDGSLAWEGSRARFAGAAVVLLGNALTGRALCLHRVGAVLGGWLGILLWSGAGLTVPAIWSAQAIRALPLPLPAAWHHVELLPFLSAPDVLICGAVTAAALWTTGAEGCMLMEMAKREWKRL